jgi:hypothetical protein
MPPDDAPLCLGERRRLRENRVRYAELSRVVKHAPERDRGDGALRNLEPLGEANRQPADICSMISCSPAQNAHQSRPQPIGLSKGQLGNLTGGKCDLKALDSLPSNDP